jgi:RNA 3'-terminal phosphate cyclase (ATP)
MKAVSLKERGRLEHVQGISAAANLPETIAERQKKQARDVLARNGIDPRIEIVRAPSPGKGTLVFLLAKFEHSLAAFDSLGALGKRAETVSDEAVSSLIEHLESGGSVDRHLADQLVPFLALAQGPSEFSTGRITRHLLTNIRVVQQFLDVAIEVSGKEGEPGIVRIAGG